MSVLYIGDMSGGTVAHEAIYYDKLACLKVLMSRGARYSMTDSKGRNLVHKVTSLLYIALYNYYPKEIFTGHG